MDEMGNIVATTTYYFLVEQLNQEVLMNWEVGPVDARLDGRFNHTGKLSMI